ncbi:MAG: hypothetical protein M3Y50_15490 [Acidobacteriota bacterium]|nr:hypothetical protein [Acidobacteriota bacterium]
MRSNDVKTKNSLRPAVLGLAAISLGALGVNTSAFAQEPGAGMYFYPGNLVVSRSVYDNNANNVKVGALLPPNCENTVGRCAKATNNGTYPYVFNNDAVDGSFGITSKIFLDQITPSGFLLDTLEVPNSSLKNIRSESNQLVTSFSSKSEGALHLSTDGKLLTFIDYVAPINALDVSNSNTPGAVDPTNPDGAAYYRAVATVNRAGRFTFTETNAYSGNNGRVAILNNTRGADVFYTSGNAGNGANPQPADVVLGAGAQFIVPARAPESFQNVMAPTPLASFSETVLGAKADKIGKDDNFRGMTIFNDVVYYTKGSGGNGVNTVYFVDTTGTACPKGVGVPALGATLPIAPLTYDPARLAVSGLPTNMCILSGFPTRPAKTANPAAFPFGIWFADAETLYVADEGDEYTGGADLYTHAAAQTTAGIQKWVFNSSTQNWSLAYTLHTGLGLGQPYVVKRYPAGNNVLTDLPWAPATDGVRNLTGIVDDGKVTLYGLTSTVSGSGDMGADPNRLVSVTDMLDNKDAAVAAKERFRVVRKAEFAEVLRGVSFAPRTREDEDRDTE